MHWTVSNSVTLTEQLKAICPSSHLYLYYLYLSVYPSLASVSLSVGLAISTCIISICLSSHLYLQYLYLSVYPSLSTVSPSVFICLDLTFLSIYLSHPLQTSLPRLCLQYGPDRDFETLSSFSSHSCGLCWIRNEIRNTQTNWRQEIIHTKHRQYMDDVDVLVLHHLTLINCNYSQNTFSSQSPPSSGRLTAPTYPEPIPLWGALFT